MKEKFKVKGIRKSLFKACHALKFTAMFLVLALVVQVTIVPNLFAQDATKHKVSGIVTSANDNAPLAGVSIQVKGTNTGTITGVDGSFSIEVSDNDVLLVSFLGFLTEEVSVAGQAKITVALVEDVQKLDEVVVIGYGVQKKKLVTGATSSVKGDDLQKQNSTYALQALQGQAAGVNITSKSGQPGGGFKVNVRGVGTIGNSTPLYVVDGIIVDDIEYLNNSDIASIDILKDAASCAIYGINGANGVVLITTKSGSSSKKQGGQISFNGYYGYQNVGRKLPLLNSEQYATLQNEAAVNSGLAPLFSQDQIKALGTGTDWLKQIFSTNVPIQDYSLSANGGNDASTYSLGLSYTEQGGIIGGTSLSDYTRYNVHANTERKLYNSALKVGEHLTFSFTDKKGIADGGLYSGNVLASAIGTSPFLAMYDSKGNYLSSINSTVYNGKTWNNTEANPYALMQYNNQKDTKSQRLIGDVYAELEPIKNLKIKSSFGLNYYSDAYHSYRPKYDKLSVYAYNDYESISQGGSQAYKWNWDNTINYLFGNSDHKFDVLAGTSIRQTTRSWFDGSNTGATLFGSFDRGYLSTSQLNELTINTDTTTHGMKLTGNADAVYAQSSVFGRLNYSYKEKYLATVVFRADGSTHFAKGHQWGYFPSLSAGWVVSSESFMESRRRWLDFLKVRASWGTNGNDNIKAFNYLSLISLENARYNFGTNNSTLTTGSYPKTIGIENTKWETSRQTDIGIDARLLNSRLSVAIDLYDKTTKDWLIAAPIVATEGVSEAPVINGGNVSNKGIELELAYNGNVGKDFTYAVSGTYAYQKNNVTDIPTSDKIIHGSTNSVYTNGPEFFRAAAGNPIGYFWGYKTEGIFQNEAEVLAWKNSSGTLIQPNAKPGDLKYADLNGDGKISADDKTNIGDPNPHHIFGLRFSCNYKNFDLSASANGVAGNKIVQSYRGPGQYGNWTTEILSRWHGEGTSNTMPRLTQNSSNWVEFSDLYVHDGSYLRISNITLGYDLAKLVKLKNLSQFHLYVTAENLFTFTKYTGMDPEVGFAVSDASGANTFGQGFDNGFYPRPRIYMVGVNITF